jgi:hypothetical protein
VPFKPIERVDYTNNPADPRREKLGNAGAAFINRLLERGWKPMVNPQTKHKDRIDIRDEQNVTVAMLHDYDDINSLAAALQPPPKEFFRIMSGFQKALADGWTLETKDDKMFACRPAWANYKLQSYTDLELWLHDAGYAQGCF